MGVPECKLLSAMRCGMCRRCRGSPACAALSCGIDTVEPFRRAATYVDRILRGAKPGDLPVRLPAKYEMAVNLKTAKALGLTIPETLLATADEVIQ
jgi:putative tryptophan/tyrosine transport system substrate-binding protein